jgi:hypothetical protein
MTALKAFIRSMLLMAGVCLTGFSPPVSNTFDVVLHGSTPGDEVVRSMLSIPADLDIDFIRWNLRLSERKTFVLDLVFGAAQPNTLGFKGGGQKRTVNGTYIVAKHGSGFSFREVYHLKSNRFADKVSLVKLSDNVFHLLTPQNRLMSGNGGWSYSLSKMNPSTTNEILFSSAMSDDRSLQTVYDGRTPCREIARDHPEMNASEHCFKLKWRLILNRDSISLLPSTYTMRKVVDNEPRDVSGKWTIIKGIAGNPGAVIYVIGTENPGEAISLLAGDDNVLFFLTRKNELYVGNGDFSFALNRKFQ